jgi:hypothetical protein
LNPTPQNAKWLWVARFEFWPTSGGSSGIPSAYAVVLMDGTIVSPEIVDKRPEDE